MLNTNRMPKPSDYCFAVQMFTDSDFSVQVMICPRCYFKQNQTQSDWHLSSELEGLLPADFNEIAESL